MITQAILYKQLGKWIGSSQELYQHLFFFKDGVAATNARQAIFVNQQNSSCYMETAKGEKWEPSSIPNPDKERGYDTVEKWLDGIIRPRFSRIKPKAENIRWSGTIPSDCYKDWKPLLEMARRLSRTKGHRLYRGGPEITETPVVVAKENTNLVLYACKNQYSAAKLFLYRNFPVDHINWAGIFNADFLFNFVDLLIDTDAPPVTLSITDDDNFMMVIENAEVWALSTPYRRDDPRLVETFYRFVNSPIRAPIIGGD